jgi:hypothetical protein
VVLLRRELIKLQIIKNPLIKNTTLYFISVIKILNCNKTKTNMELKNISEDNLGIFIGSNDVKGVTNTVTINGVKKLNL